MRLAALLVHVADPVAARAWYARAWPGAIVDDGIPGLAALRLGPLRLEFVPADAKVASGAAGSVPYWAVDDFAAAQARLESLGAQRWRGPMAIEDGQSMAQYRDPWGNCLGIVG
ncbi:VOC family protein [Piscinibacter sakaiensis]|uniref:VOC domain-containing protein n=1 Tax=Piscinibacter sakaiensis TaxID=1547922 RepID=A0A0K8NTN5_PISS1|nr:VOC family protein [Piscinibacter sakaiensis]GAP33742.1 hypothetical protein ISF6_0997 [Piscinibacter sakaiensis]